MQTDSKFYNLLGLARRAGKIGWGHDAAFDAIKYGKAHFCILTSDASDRLKSEFQRSCNFEGRSVPLQEIICGCRVFRLLHGSARYPSSEDS